MNWKLIRLTATIQFDDEEDDITFDLPTTIDEGPANKVGALLEGVINESLEEYMKSIVKMLESQIKH